MEQLLLNQAREALAINLAFLFVGMSNQIEYIRNKEETI